jgi:hypothetical protein
MHPERKLYRWEEIGDTPGDTGVYAWYYKHTLTDFDINKLIIDLKKLGSKDSASRVLAFLQTHLFQAFVEEPYDAAVRGPLKPTYQGKLANVASISPDLIDRIVAQPSRLWAIKKVLADAVPEFASPVYIGMAVSLRSRLGRHKRLIERYMAAGGTSVDDELLTLPEKNDHSFARDVVRRGFSTNGLAVAVRLIDSPESVHLEIENILNRINFPLCGRN